MIAIKHEDNKRVGRQWRAPPVDRRPATPANRPAGQPVGGRGRKFEWGARRLHLHGQRRPAAAGRDARPSSGGRDSIWRLSRWTLLSRASGQFVSLISSSSTPVAGFGQVTLVARPTPSGARIHGPGTRAPLISAHQRPASCATNQLQTRPIGSSSISLVARPCAIACASSPPGPTWRPELAGRPAGAGAKVNQSEWRASLWARASFHGSSSWAAGRFMGAQTRPAGRLAK